MVGTMVPGTSMLKKGKRTPRILDKQRVENEGQPQQRAAAEAWEEKIIINMAHAHTRDEGLQVNL